MTAFRTYTKHGTVSKMYTLSWSVLYYHIRVYVPITYIARDLSICTICKMCCAISKSYVHKLQISDPNLTLTRWHNIHHIISTQEPTSVFIFPSDYYRLEPTVTQTAPETISQLFPSVSALFTNSSIDILSRDTPAVTG